MKTNNFNKLIRWALPTFLITILMTISFSCDTIEDDYCEEVEDVCEEQVMICSSSSADYYIYEGDTIYCTTDSCTAEFDSVMSMCTVVASLENNIEIEARLQEIMTRIRLLSE